MSKLSPDFPRTAALAVLLWLSASACWSQENPEQQVIEVLTALTAVENPNPPDSPFLPFAIIESERSGRLVQFRQFEPNRVLLDIPVAAYHDENGVEVADVYLEEQTVECIKAHLERLGMQVSDEVATGLDHLGRASRYRTLNALVTVGPEDYGKMVLGIMTDCYHESQPLDLRIEYAPEG